MTVLAIGVLVNSLGIIVVTVAWMLSARRERRLTEEVTELQAVVDMMLLDHGRPTIFAQRYDLEIVAHDEPDEL